jgi:tetratricopeptide (TPR) repeat protein
LIPLEDWFRLGEKLRIMHESEARPVIDVAQERELESLRSKAESTNDARGWFAYGGRLDTLGFEMAAHEAYERVAAIGLDHLDDEEIASYYVQAGSTLRNIGRARDACRLLEQGRLRFRNNRALDAFYSLALWSTGEHASAIRTLLQALVDTGDASVRRYSRAIAAYGEALR